MNWSSFFWKQNLMRKALISLVPILIYAMYRFGLRVLLLLTVVTVAGVLTEYVMTRYTQGPKAKVSEAVLVSCLLYLLTLPPQVPYWVAVLGIIFGILFGKAVFGGFGRNVFNPALVGRCFIYISFPAYMTAGWLTPFTGFPAGLARFSPGLEAVTSATPMSALNSLGELTNYLDLFGGKTSGSLGESSALLLLLAAIYLVSTKTASWKIMVSTTASFLLTATILYLSEATPFPPLFSLLSGGFLFGAVFMATDPITAPSQDTARIIYGVLIGTFTVLIRTFSVFIEGTMFAILIANTFAPLIELNTKELWKKRKVAQ